MFCGKCGTQNEDGAKVCIGCGANLDNGQTQHSTISAVTNSEEKNRRVGMIAMVVIAIAVVIGAVSLLGGKGYKTTVDQYVNATFNVDAAAIYELIPEEVMEYVLQIEGYNDDMLEYMIDVTNKTLQQQIDSIDQSIGEGWDAEYKIVSASNIKGDELEILKSDYDDVGINVSAAKSVEIEVTIEGNGSKTSSTMNFTVVKSGGSWYLDIESLGNVL